MYLTVKVIDKQLAAFRRHGSSKMAPNDNCCRFLRLIARGVGVVSLQGVNAIMIRWGAWILRLFLGVAHRVGK